MAKRDFDLILWGATGFTGSLVAEYLATRYGVDGDLKWAIAGRNQRKLEKVRADILPEKARQHLAIFAADSQDQRSLDALARRTRVICTTVGPYARYGTPMVEACATAGTHYCDLTGEVQWMARIIASQRERAEASGARIVHTCGFDSIPSDMGTYFLQQAMLEKHGVAASRVKCRVGRSSGTFSGGTVASMLNVLDEAKRDPTVREVMADPYSLYPVDAAPGVDGPDQTTVIYDPSFHQWTCPFVMAAINGRVVRRSNALLGFPWGSDFAYDEAQLCKSRGAAVATTLAMGAGMGALAFPPTRKIMERFLPEPGEGPNREAREKGFFEMFLHAAHPEDPTKDLRARVTGDMDPGYGSTSKMLAEAAVCLAKDPLEVGGGIWTPASAMGAALLARLRANAGLTFDLIDIT